MGSDAPARLPRSSASQFLRASASTRIDILLVETSSLLLPALALRLAHLAVTSLSSSCMAPANIADGDLRVPRPCGCAILVVLCAALGRAWDHDPDDVAVIAGWPRSRCPGKAFSMLCIDPLVEGRDQQDARLRGGEKDASCCSGVGRRNSPRGPWRTSRVGHARCESRRNPRGGRRWPVHLSSALKSGPADMGLLVVMRDARALGQVWHQHARVGSWGTRGGQSA